MRHDWHISYVTATLLESSASTRPQSRLCLTRPCPALVSLAAHIVVVSVRQLTTLTPSPDLNSTEQACSCGRLQVGMCNTRSGLHDCHVQQGPGQDRPLEQASPGKKTVPAAPAPHPRAPGSKAVPQIAGASAVHPMQQHLRLAAPYKHTRRGGWAGHAAPLPPHAHMLPTQGLMRRCSTRIWLPLVCLQAQMSFVSQVQSTAAPPHAWSRLCPP
mmetsp:Transcript_943/g.1447  ORF Transcript_943/g.1447 Transcript_943/m.1447 type:complete len:215 (+) Transcript_943:1037-1681(+)